MAISFNKEVISEAIQEVLAEDQKIPVRVASKSDPSDTGSIEVMNRDKMNALKRTGKVKVDPMEEDHHENPNDDSDMAKSQLYAIAKYAIELLQMIKDGDPLDAWVQAKITKASDYIDAVQHYLEGEEYLDANQEETGEELDEIKKAEFEKIKPGKELQLRGYGVVKVIENDGIVMKIKDSLDKVHTINLGQYNEKFLKEDDEAEPSKKDIKAAEKDVKNVSDDKKANFNKALKFINKYKGNAAVVAGMIKKAKEEYKLPSNLLQDLARAAQVNEGLTENKATCCGKCGRTHVKGTECKKPFLTGQDHCRVK